MTGTFQILAVHGAEALSVLRALLEEYWRSFGFSPCFQNFAAELDGLPGDYAPPRGRLAVAWALAEPEPAGGNQTAGRRLPAGCIALRPLDSYRAEAKRLFVRPAFRGHGLGRALVQWVISEARSAGYSELAGDSLPVMSNALALYDRVGFQRTDGPNGIIYLRLELPSSGKL